LGKTKKYAIENLCNLGKTPIKIEGLDAFPARILMNFNMKKHL